MGGPGRPDLPAPTTPWEEGGGQGRLYEALARLVLALVRGAPTVLTIDDLQWPDAATLDVLPILFRRFSGRPLLVVLVVRSGEVSEAAGLRDWLLAFRQEFSATTIELGPLHDEDTGRLIGALLSRPASPETPDAPAVPAALAPLAEWVTAQAGGYPLFVVETVRGLIERGVVRYDPVEGWQPGTDLTSELRDFIAPRVREIIEGRVMRLGDAAQRMAQGAAVLGGGTTFPSLCAVAQLDEEEALAALDNLVDHHVLRETGGYYGFSHDLIRQAVYRRVGQARRVVWHRRALDVLSGEERPASELLAHALAANLTRRAAELSVAVGDEALQLFAAQDAAAHYQTAMRLAPDSRQRVHLVAQLGAACVLASDYHGGREMFMELVRLAREEGNLPRQCAGLNRLADVAAHELDFELQARLLEEALALADQSGDAVSIADTEWNVGQLCLFRSQFAEARRHHDRSLRLAREAKLAGMAARTLSWMAIADLLCGRWEAAETHATQGIALAHSVHNPFAESDLLSQRAGVLLRLGGIDEGTQIARRGFELAGGIGHAWGRAAYAMELALGLEEQGDFAGALATARAGEQELDVRPAPVAQSDPCRERRTLSR